MEVVSESINIMESQVVDQHKEKINYFLRVLSASGRGKQDLMIVEGKVNSKLSRRVVFKIRVRSFEEKKIQTQLTNV